MCHGVTCSTCHGKTWYGCGSHIPSVLDAVPESERCSCGPKVERDGKAYPPGGSLGGMLMGMFGFGGKAKGEGKEEL
ncbi:hypothetical protein WHR41_00552 [Cladosporium halotolerans]|uniref:Uncharacterized protein n=1 Tax=Cladosporium halotolerans TaxID=1052096 RepID=A0AB34L5V8_9PEZI